jgi:polyribonucleotide nucleotidyltransferase
MDFKVCGTESGITALQMDIKISGLSKDILAEALDQAKIGRKHILGKMAEAITTTQEVSDRAPRIFKLKIKQEKIRDLIGPGGKMIKKIVADTGVKVDIDDNGIVSLCAPDATSAEAAKAMVRSVTTDPEVGQIILGKAVRVVDFGVFVELRPGTDGLCHISQLDDKRVEKVEDIVKEGDEILVKVIDVDRQGRVKLSRKEAMGQKPTEA